VNLCASKVTDFTPAEDAGMADKESLTGIEQSVDQISKQTTGAMENYFGLLQKTMSTLPWSNTNLNRILLNNATQNVTATFLFMHKLAQAKNLEEVVKIQTEFMNAQLSSLNDQAKVIGEIYTGAATAAAKRST
jgi:hypothetical protein